MAKIKEEVVEKKEKAAPKIFVGKHVLYHKVMRSAVGEKLQAFPAIITQLASAVSNFKPEDGAVDLVILGEPGTFLGGRQGVMFSDVPAGGKWGYNPDL